ncbi:MAG TPA: hypothetical protein EYP21_02385 [Syntrophaceae bacterium]|nr:hypothetical protein [Syntrophaceae bacterium]
MPIFKSRLTIAGVMLFLILGAISMMSLLNDKKKDLGTPKTSQVAKAEDGPQTKQTHGQEARHEAPKTPEVKAQSEQQVETEKVTVKENQVVKEVVKPILNPQPPKDEKKSQTIRVITQEDIREIYKKRMEALRYLE